MPRHYEPDEDERREAWEERQARNRATGCACGYPDWPGRCPGTASCPLAQSGYEED